jgi:hypothetical protein
MTKERDMNRAEIESRVGQSAGRLPFAHNDLKDAFDRVRNPKYSNGPIDAVVPFGRADITAVAIYYFTGNVPAIEIDEINGVVLIRTGAV